jgi:iron complex outermembrane receptor protein
MTRHILAASTALAAALIATAAAQAQDAPTTQAQTNAGQVDVPEIIVTATKRETSLQKTPIAVSAFSQATLDRQQVKDITGLADFVPSLHFAQQGDQNAILLTLRGIGNDSAYTEVADPEVAIYVDGIYSPRAQGASVLMYDMERVEVLRGPQGTLFGRNATVGAVSMITAKPTLDKFYGSVEAVGGSFSRFGVRGMVNIPVTDTFAIRAAVISDRHDGYIDYQKAPNLPGVNASAFVSGGKKYYAADQQSARVSALWKPSDSFSWNLSGEYYKDTGSPILSLLQTPRPGQKFWSALVDTAPEQNRHSYSARSNMNYDLTDHIALAYIAGYSKISGGGDSDADAGALPPTLNPDGTTNFAQSAFGENRTVWSSYEFYSHELQFKSTGHNAIDWIVGGYYSHETNKIRFDVDNRNGYRDGTPAFVGSFIQADRSIQSSAAFGQAIWHVNNWINLTGGIRYTSDKKQDKGGRNITGFCPFVNGAADPSCANIPGIFGVDPGATAAELLQYLNSNGGNFYSISNNDVKGKWNKVTWLARADANITDTTLVYASVSTGFKSGNIEDGGRTANPETLTNYEVGTKSRLFGGRATLNLAAYYEDFKGYQVNQAINVHDAAGNVLSSSLVTTNAKGAKAYGFEAELSANLTRQDHLQIAATVQKTKFEDLLTLDGRLYGGPITGDPEKDIENLKGNELAHAPRFSATASYDHDFLLANGGKLSPRFTLHYETSSWLSYFNGDDASRYVEPSTHVDGHYGTDFDKQKAYAKIDLSMNYTAPSGAYSIEAFSLNVTDKRIRTSAGVQGPNNGGLPAVFLSNYEAPRTWGVRVSAKF